LLSVSGKRKYLPVEITCIDRLLSIIPLGRVSFQPVRGKELKSRDIDLKNPLFSLL
jgi:hypothetical protein